MTDCSVASSTRFFTLGSYVEGSEPARTLTRDEEDEILNAEKRMLSGIQRIRDGLEVGKKYLEKTDYAAGVSADALKASIYTKMNYQRNSNAPTE